MKKIGKLFTVLLVVALLASIITLVVSGSGETATAGEETTLDKEAIINESLVMKVNSGNSLLNGKKTVLSGEPYKENGVIMIPLDAVTSYTGKTPASYTSTVKNGVTYIAMDDIESNFSGFYVTYDEVGLIFIAKYDEFLNRNNDELLMHETAKRFIYTYDFREINNSAGANIIDVSTSDPIKNKDAYIDSFDFSYLQTQILKNVPNTDGKLQHPYILADQEKFDELNDAYTMADTDADYDEELAWYIETQIAYADTYLAKYANFDENGNYDSLKKGHWVYDSQGMASWDTTSGDTEVSQMPYTEGYEWMDNPQTTEEDYDYYRYDEVSKKYVKGYGYDPAGGRLNVLSDGETCLVAALEPAALAYQITREDKYLDFAYDWMYALCQWEHWGPGHYLNCANTARPLATAYDWLYNDFVRVYGQDKVDYLAQRIYENAVYEATVTLTGNAPEHERASGDSSRYWNHYGNWNSCGTLGMLIASLAIMDQEDYQQDALYVISASLAHYMERGMTYITFDGAYRESAGYWGTVRFMHFITKILIDTTGTDFGLLDFPGIDLTDYFGCQMESNDYSSWNYHDDWIIAMPSYWYYLSADLYDNPEYAAIRYTQLHSGSTKTNKLPFRYDLLFYDKDLVESIKNQEVDLTLDYVMTSIDATVSRSSWDSDSGALYTGIMGGRNNTAHGQYDSGNWIYENAGIRWFVDLGADDYNLAGDGLSMGYYKYSAEGNNTLALTSLPHGQTFNRNMDTDGSQPVDGGEIISSIVNEYGSATVIDQTGAYNGQYREYLSTGTMVYHEKDDLANFVEYAYRGMLLTNNRRTVVIQDEVKTLNNNPETFWWFAHYDTTSVFRVDLSEDGRTAYMLGINADNEIQRLRVTLVSDNENLKFQIMDTTEENYVLDTPNSTDDKYKTIWATNEAKGTVEGKRSNIMKLAVKAENVTELNMAVVIELVGQGKEEPELGYKELVSMHGWTVEDGEDIEIPETNNLTYTVYYNDGTHDDFKTSKLSAGTIVEGTEDDDRPYLKANIERIECYGIVILDLQTNMYQNDTLTINLNGNTFIQKSIFRLGNQSTANNEATLTINGGGGTWEDLHGTGIQCRFGTTLTVNDVTIKSAGYLVRDEGAKISYNNCNINVGAHVINGIIQTLSYESDSHYFILNNTSLVANGGLLKYETPDRTEKNQNFGIYLMGDTSLSFDGGKSSAEQVVIHNSDYMPGVYNFYIEDGVKLTTNGFVTPESGAYTNPDGETSEITYNVNYRTGMSYENGTLDIGDALYAGDEDVIFGTDVHKYTINESGDETFPYIVGKEKLPIYFYVYNKDGVVEYYTSNIAAALPTNYVDNGVYKIVLAKDSTVSSEAKLGNAQHLTIDLNNKTLTATARITLGPSVTSPIGCTVIVTNGTYEKTQTNGFLCRLGTALIFDGVTLKLTGEVAWDNGASLIAFNNCNVTSTSYLLYGRFANAFTGEEGNKHELVFNDSTVDVKTSIIEYGEQTDTVEYLNIFVTGDSTLKYQTPFTISTAHPATIASATYNVYIEKGALMPYSDFGLPEDTETADYNLYGCQYVDLDDEYRVVSFIQFANMKVVASGDYYTVELVSFVKGVKSSLTLYADFTINFYLPIEGNVIDLVRVNGVEYPINEQTETYTEGGVSYYKVAIKNIAAGRAAEDIKIIFVSEGVEETKLFSVIRYCEILFSSAKYLDSYALVASAVNYINESYEYSGYAKPARLTDLTSSLIYKSFIPEKMPADQSTADLGNIGVAFRSVQLDLGASVNFRFNLNANFSGTVVIDGVTYDVIEGECYGLAYLTVSLRAYDMYDPIKCIEISGTAEGGTEFYGTYDLRAYINYYGGKGDDLDQLLSALYTYCTEAYENRYGTVVERPDLGDTPDSPIEF